MWKENYSELDNYFQRLVQSLKIFIGSLKKPGVPPLFSKSFFYYCSCLWTKGGEKSDCRELKSTSLTLFNEKTVSVVKSPC